MPIDDSSWHGLTENTRAVHVMLCGAKKGSTDVGCTRSQRRAHVPIPDRCNAGAGVRTTNTLLSQIPERWQSYLKVGCKFVPEAKEVADI